MNELLSAFEALPENAKHEALDYLEFLYNKYKNKELCEKRYWHEVGQETINKVWDNKEDDVYAELL